MVQVWAANPPHHHPPDPTPAALGSLRQLGCPLTRTRGGVVIQMSKCQRSMLASLQVAVCRLASRPSLAHLPSLTPPPPPLTLSR